MNGSQTGELTRLFHPRIDDWNEHFSRRGGEIIGSSPVGRAANIVNQPLDLILKAPAHFRDDSRVISSRVGVLLRGLGMERMGLHQPTISRMRWETSPPAMPAT